MTRDSATVYGLAAALQLLRELVCELRGHRNDLFCSRCGYIEPNAAAAILHIARTVGAAFQRAMLSLADVAKAARRIEESLR